MIHIKINHLINVLYVYKIFVKKIYMIIKNYKDILKFYIIVIQISVIIHYIIYIVLHSFTNHNVKKIHFYV